MFREKQFAKVFKETEEFSMIPYQKLRNDEWFEITFNKYLFCVWHPETIGRNSIILDLKEGFPGRSDGQDPPAMRDTGFDPWVGKIPWRREGLPTPVFWPGEFQGLYSPWDRKESDMTERLSLTFT